MQYTKLGNSDLDVSRICMGCMGFGDARNGQHSWTLDEEHSCEISQIGYSQSASLLAPNLIAAIAAFQWESALPLKQGSPNPPLSPWRLRSGGLGLP